MEIQLKNANRVNLIISSFKYWPIQQEQYAVRVTSYHFALLNALAEQFAEVVWHRLPPPRPVVVDVVPPDIQPLGKALVIEEA